MFVNRTQSELLKNASIEDFDISNGSLKKDGKLGFTFTAAYGNSGWALKPIQLSDDVISIKSYVSTNFNGQNANAFLAVGDGTDKDQVLKIGIYYGKNTICIEYATNVQGHSVRATVDRGEQTPIEITIDQKKRLLFIDVNGDAFSCKFPQSFKRITHAGYANVGSNQECSPLEIKKIIK